MTPPLPKKYYCILKLLLILIVIIAFGIKSNAQSVFLKNDYDTSYIHSATEELTSRLLSSISYTDILFRDQNLNATLAYSVHSKYRFGIGFNYSIFGINLSFSPFNNSAADSKYGETKSIDLRMNLYGRSVMFDLYLIKHTGFYLSNPESILIGYTDQDTYPLRPDIKVFSTGIVTQYIVNNKKYSMRATYLQNEWQKKSSGSLIFGVSIFYSQYNADSSFIPTNIKYPDFLGGLNFNHSSSMNFGVNGGYSYTFVVKQHFFLSAGLTVGPQFIYSVLKCDNQSQPDKSAGSLGINALIRAGIGYNSKKAYVGAFFISENLANTTALNNATTLMSIGIFKLNFVYRFTLKKPIKFLNPNYWKFLQPKEK